eukprot:scaffold1673_cov330-Pavlova_lutheri.AAC.11
MKMQRRCPSRLVHGLSSEDSDPFFVPPPGFENFEAPDMIVGAFVFVDHSLVRFQLVFKEWARSTTAVTQGRNWFVRIRHGINVLEVFRLHPSPFSPRRVAALTGLAVFIVGTIHRFFKSSFTATRTVGLRA